MSIAGETIEKPEKCKLLKGNFNKGKASSSCLNRC